MAIHFDPVRPAAIPVKPALPARPHAAAPTVPQPLSSSSGTRASSSKPAVAFSAVFAPTPTATGGHRTAPPPTPAATPAPAVGSTTATPAPAATPAATAPATTPAANSNAAANGNAAFTAEQVFGPNPWLSNPAGTGPNGVTFGYNPLYFATPSTAAAVARMVGGTVVEDNEFTKNTPGTPFVQQQPNEMVRLPTGALINPGLIASLYTHGLPQWEVDQAIANEVAGANAAVKSIQS